MLSVDTIAGANEPPAVLTPYTIITSKISQRARWQSGLMRMTRNHIPSGSCVRIALASIYFLPFFALDCSFLQRLDYLVIYAAQFF